MNHIHEGHLNQFANSPVLSMTLVILAWLFYLQSAYYFGCAIRSLNVMMRHFWTMGTHRNIDNDPENDIGHMLCMLLMGHHLSPQFGIAQTIPDSIAILCWIWFSVRGVTWGLRIAGNKSWWDAIHAGMFFGMYLMNNPQMPGRAVLIPAQLVFWIWFTGHYAKEIFTASEIQERFSCFAHFDMGLAMLLMTIVLTASIIFDKSDIASQDTLINEPVFAVMSLEHPAKAFEVKDDTFEKEVLMAKTPVAVLVYGGCAACSEDVRIFNELALAPGTKASFAKINLDISPKSCARLGVDKCPTILVVASGKPAQNRLYNITDRRKIKDFLDSQTARCLSTR